MTQQDQAVGGNVESGTSSPNPTALHQPLRGLFERRFGEPVERVTPLKGDASDRKLFRLSAASHTAIGVVNPDARENRAFLEFSRHFGRCGLPVPEIYAEDLDRGMYLEEDLGDTTLFQFLTANRVTDELSSETLDLYRKVVELLPRFQIEAGRTLNYDVCYPRSSFDRQSMLWDLNYFKYYFLRLAKIPFSEQALEDDFERFAEFLLQAERRFFLYRDFQSRNIMVRDGRPFFIDYQGGRRGALQYDVASLLFDAKADLPFEVRDELLERYLEAAATLEPIDRHAFLTFYPGFVSVRIMQAMGAYGLRGFYERKHHFLASIPYAIRNLEYLLRTTALPVELPELTQVWRRLVASSALRQFGTASLKLTVRIQSFAYTDGVPTDEKGHGGGYVFDCRALPNPGRFEEYTKLTGQDDAVKAFLENEPAVGDFIRHVFALIDQTVENYQRRNFTDLLVAFGCTGGQHRSVYCAERLATHLREQFQVHVEVRHLARENSTPTPGPLPGGEGEKR
ncbi:MAG: phosphotransferase [candidate division NC10 bacterium]|nr:phosphotransferase [candidate division NC10 bacterium]MBI2114819.1 phosphotransferase [candidate division NC10 bacterium]MBI2563325.1 phosphotransferase [candidate division NC10 bacterium]